MAMAKKEPRRTKRLLLDAARNAGLNSIEKAVFIDRLDGKVFKQISAKTGKSLGSVSDAEKTAATRVKDYLRRTGVI